MSTPTQQQQQVCSVCSAPCRSAARPTCSLRCHWKSTGNCCQCGRKVVVSNDTTTSFKTFCSALCLDEARKGNWCVACGCKQVTTQGLTRCSSECMAVDIPHNMIMSMMSSSESSSSPFPSRRTTPGEGEGKQQQQMMINGQPQQQQQNRVSCSAILPGSKLFERIATPFYRAGLQVFQVIQVNNTAADKKSYNGYRLSVDQRLSANRIRKYGLGGEGNEHKRFVPLMAGCGMHLYGLRFASAVAQQQFNNNNNDDQNNNNNCGVAQTCQDPACDVCRILESGLKLSAITGRTSHFSVPTLESVLPWCNDAASSIVVSTPPSVNYYQQPQQQRFQAVTLVRTVLGNVQLVRDMNEVAADQPASGFDSVVFEEEKKQDSNAVINNNSAFNYNDQSILAEYIVLFDSSTISNNNTNYQQQQYYNNNSYYYSQQQQQQQQQYYHHQQAGIGYTTSLNTSSSTTNSEQPIF